jgi:hypothetical protein
MAPKKSPIRPSFKLTVNPTPLGTFSDLSNTRESATIKSPSQNNFSHPDPSHLIKEVDVVIKSDDRVSDAASSRTANFGPPGNTEVAKADREEYTGEPPHAWMDTRDYDDRYFDVEAIKSCKLNSRVCSSLDVPT